MSTTHQPSTKTGMTPEEMAARLNKIVNNLSRRMRRSYHASRITPARLSALSVVVEDGPLTAGQLAQVEQVTAPVITRMLAALEEDDLITRRADSADRRIVRVECTDRGRLVVGESREWRIGAFAERLRSLDSRDRAAIGEALDALESLG